MSKEEKQQPQSSGVEIIVLGSILIEGSIIDKIISEFSVNLFFEIKNKAVAQGIIDLYKSNTAIDLVTIVSQLKKNETLEKAGGVKYISTLTAGIGSTSNIEYHLRILQEEALRRSLIKIGNTAVSRSFDSSFDVFDVYTETVNDLDSALKNVINYEIKTAGQVHDEIIKKSIAILTKGENSGIPSGMKMLDNVTNGWQRSDLIILAGRPSMGKTAAAISMCMFPSIEKKIPIAIFSLEMSNEQLVSRMQSYFSGVNVSKIVKKQLKDDEIIKIDKMANYLKEAPIYIDDTPNISLLELKGKARKLKKESGIELIIVDYLQLMRSGQKTSSREQEIAEISRGLKTLAKELNVPVIALSQLSRSVEARGGDKKPMLQDLRESGQIEQDADMVLFCYRPEYYGIDQYEVGAESFNTDGLFMLIVAKHRNGELGEIPLRFIHEQTKLTNYNFYPESIGSNIELNRTFVQQDKQESEVQTISSSAITPNTEFNSDSTKTNTNLGSDEFDMTSISDEPPF